MLQTGITDHASYTLVVISRPAEVWCVANRYKRQSNKQIMVYQHTRNLQSCPDP
jgi:hypothetical protein